MPTYKITFGKSGESTGGSLAVDIATLAAAEYPTKVVIDGAGSFWTNRDSITASISIAEKGNTSNRVTLRTWSDGATGALAGTWDPLANGIKLKGKAIVFYFDCQVMTQYAHVWNSNGITVTTAYDTTACGAPGTPSVSTTVAEGTLTLSWTAGGAGTNNSVTGYQIQYRDSTDNSNWGSWTDYSTVGIVTSASVNPPGTRGAYRQFRVRTLGSAGSSYYSSYTAASGSVRRNTLPGAPSGLSASPAIWESGNITLKWTKGTNGTSAITAYLISSRTSADGTNYGSWSAETDVGNVATRTFAPTLARGSRIQYRIRSKDALGVCSDYVNYAAVMKNTLPGAPTGFSAAPALWESGNITLAWTAAKAGSSAVSGYEYAYKQEGGSYGAAVSAGSGTSKAVTAPSFDRGNRIMYRLRTVDALGAASDWVESGWVKRNSLPGAPSDPSAAPALFDNGSITVEWTAAADADGNLSKYEVQYSVSADGAAWGGWTDLDSTAETQCAHAITDAVLPRGSYIKYRVRAVDELGAASGYAETGAVRRNSIPIAPQFVLPVADSIKTLKPAFKASYAADTEGEGQTMHYRVSNGTANVQSGDISLGKGAGSICFRLKNNLAAGTYTVYIQVNDGLASSAETSQSITVATCEWSRNIVSGTVIANSSISHQVDIDEMVSRANEKRKAYGLGEFAISGNGYWAKWLTIMNTIMARVADCYAAVGETVSTQTQESQYPTAGTVNRIRNLISEV